MSSMAFGGGSLAGISRVAFESTGVGEVTRDIDRVERTFRSSAEGMSDAAIKAELAQRRLQSALKAGPAAYDRQARAELNLRRVEAELRGENQRLEGQFRETQRQMDRFGRGAVAGSGVLRGLGRNLAFASAGFLGGTGLVYGIRSAINVASNLEEQMNKTRVTFRESGQEVIEWSRSSATSFGIAQDQALSYTATLGGILNVSGLARSESARLSRELVQLAADMASFNNASPEETLEALRSGLVGESEPLRRYQVLLSAARVEQQAYASGIAESGKKLTEQQKVLARYQLILRDTADQQGDFARTSEGLANSQRTLSALWRDAQGLLGQALAPAYTDVVQGLRDWLAEDENRVQLQQEINRLVGDASEVARGFAEALRLVKEAGEPIVDLFGGIGKTIEAVTLLWVAFKVKALLGFGATATASRLTSASMVRDAAVAGAAWDVATRPRVMTVVQRIGQYGAPIPAGAPGGGRRIPPVLTGNLALTTVAAVVASAGGGTQRGDRSAQYPLVYDAVARAANGAATPGEVAVLRSALGQYSLANAPDERMARAERQLRRLRQPRPGERPDESVVAQSVRDAERRNRARRRTRGGGRAGGLTFAEVERGFAGFEERALDVVATTTTADDVRLERDRLALARRALRELDLTREQRIRVKNERNRALQALAALDQQEDQEAAAIQEKRAAATEQRRQQAEARMERIRAAAARQAQRRLDLLGDVPGTRAGMRKAALRGVDEVVKGVQGGKTGDEKGLTAAQVHAMQFEFLSRLTGEIGQFGSNFAADSGQLSTQALVQTQLLRGQNAALDRLIEGSWHAGAQLASADLAAAGWGVGF